MDSWDNDIIEYVQEALEEAHSELLHFRSDAHLSVFSAIRRLNALKTKYEFEFPLREAR